MKKVILLATVAIMSITTGLAQEKAIKESKFKNHWFLQGQFGASYTFSENQKNASFGDLITPHAAISVGKYFAPAAGARLQVGGWKSKAYTGSSYYNFKYMQVNVDGLLNLTNVFLPYKEDRVFNLIGIAGLGYVHGFKNTKGYHVGETNSIVPRIGLQADFRVTSNFSLNLEAVGNLMSDDFNGNKGGDKYDGTVNVLAGATYRFGKTFKTVDIIDPAAMTALNDQINQQRSMLSNKDVEIKRLNTELAHKPAPIITKEVREETEVLMNAVVVFRLGSSQLEKNQDINIYNAARYLKDNPNVDVTVTGYADKSTGSKAVNQRISQQRADAVAKILIDKYDISESRITTKASGDTEQLFPTDEWNRVVVFTAKTK